MPLWQPSSLLVDLESLKVKKPYKIVYYSIGISNFHTSPSKPWDTRMELVILSLIYLYDCKEDPTKFERMIENKLHKRIRKNFMF